MSAIRRVLRLPRVAVINLVGLCRRHLGEGYAPRDCLHPEKWLPGPADSPHPARPHLLCPGDLPDRHLAGSEHGIVGNGWYDRSLNEHQFLETIQCPGPRAIRSGM